MPAPPGTGQFIGVDILRTDRDASGMISAQLGDSVAADADSQEASWWQHAGFCSRPPKAVKGRRSAQAVTLRTSQNDAVIASRDTRTAEVYGLLGDGETCLYAAGENGTSQARVMLKNNGAINLVTAEGNASSGTLVMLVVGPDGLKFTSPWGTLSFGPDGFSVVVQNGTTQKCVFEMKRSDGVVAITGPSAKIQTSTITLGVGATAVSPVLYGQSGFTGLPSLSVFVSP